MTSGSTSEISGSTTDAPPPQCECPTDGNVFCEDFETLDEGSFEPWVVPSGGGAVPPEFLADDVCGRALRASIDGGETFSVLARTVDVQDVVENPASRLRGIMRIDEECANQTEHRLVQLRFDQTQFLYDVSLFLDPKGASFQYDDSSLASPVVATIKTPPLGTWFEFGINVVQETSSGPGMFSVTIDGQTSAPEYVGPTLDNPISVNVVLGPFAPAGAAKAGCTVDFDNVALYVGPPGL